MAVSVIQNPNEFDWSYGPNFITLSNIGNAEKYLVRVREWETDEIIATVEQSPNAENRAQFDLQKIFQQLTRVSKPTLDQLGQVPSGVLTYTPGLSDASYEMAKIKIEVGSITGGSATYDATLTAKYRINGLKPYYQIYQNEIDDELKAVIERDDFDACVIIQRRGKILTERPLNQIQSGATPPSVSSGTDYLAVKLSSSDFYTVSYWNELERLTPLPPAEAVGIEAFEICEFDANDQILNRTYIPNIQVNGGGPNVTYREGALMAYPYHAITVGVGPANLEGMKYEPTSAELPSPSTFSFNANTVKYWVVPRVYTPALCSQQYLSQASHDPVMVVLDNSPSCLEYPTVQASWLNKYGFRDWFNFNLKQEISQTQKTNSFQRSWNDYNSLIGGYGIAIEESIMAGGETIFNKALDQRLRFNTNYLSDADSYYLDGLFKSPNLRLRTDSNNIALFTNWPDYQSDKFFPAVLTNSAYTEKTYRKNKLFQFELQARLAHKPITQRGS